MYLVLNKANSILTSASCNLSGNFTLLLGIQSKSGTLNFYLNVLWIFVKKHFGISKVKVVSENCQNPKTDSWCINEVDFNPQPQRKETSGLMQNMLLL